MSDIPPTGPFYFNARRPSALKYWPYLLPPFLAAFQIWAVGSWVQWDAAWAHHIPEFSDGNRFALLFAWASVTTLECLMVSIIRGQL